MPLAPLGGVKAQLRHNKMCPSASATISSAVHTELCRFQVPVWTREGQQYSGWPTDSSHSSFCSAAASTDLVFERHWSRNGLVTRNGVTAPHSCNQYLPDAGSTVDAIAFQAQWLAEGVESGKPYQKTVINRSNMHPFQVRLSYALLTTSIVTTGCGGGGQTLGASFRHNLSDHLGSTAPGLHAPLPVPS